MSLLTGVLKVQCNTELKEEIRKSGKAACVLMMDEIKNMDNVVDVWDPKDKLVDIIVETNAESKDSINNLISKIHELEGVFQITPKISIDVND